MITTECRLRCFARLQRQRVLLKFEFIEKRKTIKADKKKKPIITSDEDVTRAYRSRYVPALVRARVALPRSCIELAQSRARSSAREAAVVSCGAHARAPSHRRRLPLSVCVCVARHTRARVCMCVCVCVRSCERLLYGGRLCRPSFGTTAAAAARHHRRPPPHPVRPPSSLVHVPLRSVQTHHHVAADDAATRALKIPRP